MRDLLLAVELDKEGFFRLPTEVSPVGAKLSLDV
jgi:hypothetical protein